MVKTQIGIKFPGEDIVLSWLKPEYAEVIALATSESDRLGHHAVGTEHLLLGLILQEKSIAAQALKSVGVTTEKVLSEMENIITYQGENREFKSSFTPHAKQVIEKTLVFYRDINQPLNKVIGAESLLLAIIGKQEVIAHQANYTNYAAVQILQNLGVNLLGLTTQVIQLLSQQPPSDENPSASENF